MYRGVMGRSYRTLQNIFFISQRIRYFWRDKPLFFQKSVFLQKIKQIKMETVQGKTHSQNHDALLALRQRVSSLVSQTESEELLAEAVAILSGMPLPCAYTYEQMESSLREAEADYQERCHVSHTSICERYGV